MAKVPDFLQELAKELQAEQEKTKPKKEAKPPSEFQQKLNSLKKELKNQQPKPKINGAGYEYVYDDEGKLRVRSQVEWERYHPGRKVEEHQRVYFRNGNKKDFSKENLILGYKSGVSLDALTCKNCGCRGNWEMGEIE